MAFYFKWGFMENKQWLMIDTIKIGVLYALVLCSGISAMDLSVVKKDKTQVLTFKSLEGLPCFSLQGIKKLWEKFPEPKKKKITQLLMDTKDERIITLFNVATQLPTELHTRIVSWLFNEHGGVATKLFVNKPLMSSVDRYVFSQQVMKRAQLTSFVDIVAPQSRNLKKVCSIDTIFELFDDIIVFDKVFRQQSTHPRPTCSRKELAAVCQVLQSFPQINRRLGSLPYDYRDVYTPSNIAKSISVLQLCGVVMLVMPAISTLLAENCCNKVLIDYLVEQNRCSVIKNEALWAAFEKTGEQFLLKDLYEIVDPWGYSYFDYAKVISPHLLTGWICEAIHKGRIPSLLEILKKNKFDAFCVTGSGVVSCIILVWVFVALSYGWPVFESELMVHCSLLGSYIVACFAYNLAYMYSRKCSRVDVNDISDVLQNKNIVIE